MKKLLAILALALAVTGAHAEPLKFFLQDVKTFYPSRNDQGPWLFDFAAAGSGNGAENFLEPGITITTFTLTLRNTSTGEVVPGAIVNSALVDDGTAVKAWVRFPDANQDLLLTCHITTSKPVGAGGAFEEWERSMLFKVRIR